VTLEQHVQAIAIGDRAVEVHDDEQTPKRPRRRGEMIAWRRGEMV